MENKEINKNKFEIGEWLISKGNGKRPMMIKEFHFFSDLNEYVYICTPEMGMPFEHKDRIMREEIICEHYEKFDNSILDNIKGDLHYYKIQELFKNKNGKQI